MNTCYCIIPHATKSLVFVVQSENRWSLPHVEYTERWIAYDVGTIAQKVYSEYGIDVTVLRHIQSQDDRIHICELENHNPEWILPTNGRWVGRKQLKDISFSIAVHQKVLETWFTEVEKKQIPVLRPPWERKGWFSEAVAWIQTQFSRLGSTAIEPVEQVKAVWSWSSILRVRTTDGYMYFKADYAKPPSEPALISVLAERWPSNVPCIVAADFDRRWMLMRDFEGEPLWSIPYENENWEAVVRLFAEMQIDCATRMERWIDLGCLYLGPNQMIEYIDQIIADTPTLKQGPNGLNEREYTELYSFAPRLKEMCTQLRDYAIPDTLVPQDFTHYNVMVVDKTYLYYDLSDTVIAHPFISMNRFLTEWACDFERADNQRQGMLLNAYLEPWTTYEPMARLFEAFGILRQLYQLYRAIYWYIEMPYLELTSPWPKQQVGQLATHLREILKMEAPLKKNDELT